MSPRGFTRLRMILCGKILCNLPCSLYWPWQNHHRQTSRQIGSRRLLWSEKRTYFGP